MANIKSETWDEYNEKALTGEIQKLRAEGGISKRLVARELERKLPSRRAQMVPPQTQRPMPQPQQRQIQRPRPAMRKGPVQSMVRKSAANSFTNFVAGRRIPGTHNKGYSSRGRPKGSFYKYSIPGKGPVGVFEWRKYQRYRQRMLAMQIQQQNPELNLNEARAALRQVQPTQTYIPQQPIQQPQQMYQQTVPVQIVQQRPIDDGWGLLRVKSPFSNMAPARPVNPIANAQAPIGNRNTAYYSEPDFISGKQVMKQRPNMGGFGLW